MANCKNCKANCAQRGTHYTPDAEAACYVPMTNADRFRTMTDEELANRLSFLASCNRCPITACPGGRLNCTDYWIDWLKEEVQE